MREVINYKPDIFTRCFCFVALPVRHGCQCISSSCALLLSCFFPYLIFSKVALEDQFHTDDRPIMLNVLMQNNENSRPEFSVFLWCIQLILLFIFYCICLFIANAGQQGTFVLCPEPK